MPSIALSVSHVSIDSGPPRVITFQFKTPYVSPLYLAILTLYDNSALASLDGQIVPGNGPNAGGTCDLNVPSAIFNPIWDFVTHHTKLSVTITYDANLMVTQLSVTSSLIIVNTDLLEAALASLGSIDVAELATNFNLIASTLVNALGRGPLLRANGGQPAEAD